MEFIYCTYLEYSELFVEFCSVKDWKGKRWYTPWRDYMRKSNNSFGRLLLRMKESPLLHLLKNLWIVRGILYGKILKCQKVIYVMAPYYEKIENLFWMVVSSYGNLLMHLSWNLRSVWRICWANDWKANIWLTSCSNFEILQEWVDQNWW